jgi:phosphoribosylamine--glycine ligase
MKRILIVGQGGREHALAWRLQEVAKVWVTPGNGGISLEVPTLDVSITDFAGVLALVREYQIDLVIIGPEAPLEGGIVDYLRANGVTVFGPNKWCAQLESSKAFAKEIMHNANTPTPLAKVVNSKEEALALLTPNQIFPVVLKADSLAAGKGVVVCSTFVEINQALDFLFGELQVKRLLIEEFITGREVSYIVAVNGGKVLPLATSHDYKRLNDGDLGPNTGGMGTVSPTPRLSLAQEKEVLNNIILPVLSEMVKVGEHYNGFLYAGLMVSDDGSIRVIEFNARLGDPESQVIMLRLERESLPAFIDFMADSSTENRESLGYAVSHELLKWSEVVAICVVLASSGYPSRVITGSTIKGIKDVEGDKVKVFHCATKVLADGNFVANGGRVLNVTATGRTIQEARGYAYEAIKDIDFPAAHYRYDIGRS